jgi:glucokinase
MKKSPRSSSHPLVLAYDIGGTKIAVGVVDRNGKILAAHREPILIRLGKKAVLQQIIRLGSAYIEQYPQIKAVGIASAGPLDPEKGILLDPTNFKGPDGPWGKVPLTKLISKGLGLKVYLENDAAAAMLAEHWVGAARKTQNAMILTLGTGLGTGFITNGQLVRGGRYMHTEAGHILLNPNDKTAPCGCGNYGCSEAYLSGKAFTHRARKILKNGQIDAVQIAARARGGDQKAKKLFDEYAEHLAVTLHNLIVVFYPEQVVLTGSFAATSDLFVTKTLKNLEKLLERRNKLIRLTPQIKVSSLENQAGLLGGAYIALHKHGVLAKR